MSKRTYRIRNWSDYNKALINRGSLTVWFDEKSIVNWNNAEKTGKKGRPFYFADVAIEYSLTLRILFRLPLRATQGLIRSLTQLLALRIKAPNYTTISRRQSNITVNLSSKRYDEPMHLVVDSSGMKLYGEGEWKVRKHGWSKRRTWRKLHIGVDTKTQDIIVAEITSGNAHDAPVFDNLIDQLPSGININKISGDGAYDSRNCYAKTLAINAEPNFPPKLNVRMKLSSRDEITKKRNYAFMSIHCRGKDWWAKKTNYHQRSLAETAFFRIKKLFGYQISNQKSKNQITELLLRCRMLNKINEMGMPDSYFVTL